MAPGEAWSGLHLPHQGTAKVGSCFAKLNDNCGCTLLDEVCLGKEGECCFANPQSTLILSKDW